MSRYDRRRERKRVLVLVGFVVAFGIAVYAWGHSAEADLADAARVSAQSGQD